MEEEIENNNEEIVSVGLKATYFDNLIDRFFYKIYINKGETNEQYIFIHSNGIVLCGLGNNNTLIQNRQIKEIVDLGKLVQVKGKRKHGAKIIQENESVLELKLISEEKVKFSPKITKGKLMEINDKVIKDNSILFSSPEKFGYLCMLFIDQSIMENIKNKYPISG